MEIKNVVVKPYEKSVPQGLSFEVEISRIKYEEAIIGVNGWLESDDGMMIANVIEAIPEKIKSEDIGAKESSFDPQFKEEVYKTTVIAPLNGRALDYLEKRRTEDKKGDIYLTLNLNVRSIENRARVSHIHEVNPKDMGLPPLKISTSSGMREGTILAYAYDREFSVPRSNLWVISGNGNPVFISVKEQILRKERIRVPSLDWIHDYAPILGLGEFFIIEIPKGKEVVEKAWRYIEKAEECFRKWDSKGAYANCREVGKLLNEIMEKNFEGTPTIKKWKRAIKEFNYLTSLDLHIEEIKEEEPKGEVVISKADTDHILIVTKALIKYAGELLREK